MSDPRLASLYDADNPAGLDHDHYRRLADDLGTRTIVDLGCGTGLLSVTLATGPRQIIGIDPDLAMLDIARHRPGGERVEWIHGDSRVISAGLADLVIMSGNVAQHLVGEVWTRSLRDLAAGLRPGGTVAFESRHPPDRAWERWDRAHTFGTRDTSFGRLTEWLEVTEITGDPLTDGTVTFVTHNEFSSGEQIAVRETLAFRSREVITRDLAAVGLRVVDVRGGWSGQPVTPDSRVLVFEARRDDS